MRFSAFTTLALVFLGAMVAAQEFDEFGGSDETASTPRRRISVTEFLLGSVAAKATPAPEFDPATVSGLTTIAGIRFSGSGCPARTVIPGLSPDFKVITLKFTRFDLKLDQYKRVRRARKTCNIRLAVRTPTGYSFSFLSTAVDGDLFLSDANIAASFTTVSYLTSIPQSRSVAVQALDLSTLTPINVGDTFYGLSENPPVPAAILYVNQNDLVSGEEPLEPSADPVPTKFTNPWWSQCPPNHGNFALGTRFERSVVAFDLGVQLERLRLTSVGYVSANSLSGRFEHGTLLDWQQCATLWNSI